MKILQYRFIYKNESFLHKEFQNWSRCYEWGYVLEQAKQAPADWSVHNTSCGYAEIHEQFHRALNSLPNPVIHSDIIESEITKKLPNFQLYNLYESSKEKFDVVLCISTLEHLDQERIEQVIENLARQAKHRLIITCDYPEVGRGVLNKALEGIGCKPSFQEHNMELLNGSNSPYPVPDKENDNIILIDLEV